MALGTVTPIGPPVNAGGLVLQIIDIQPSTGANWTAAGEAFDVAQVPGAHGQLLALLPQPSAGAGVNSPTFGWDPVARKLLAFGTAGSATGLTAIAGNTDLSGFKLRALAITTGIG